MKSFRSFFSNTIFALNILLLVLLIFREQVIVPGWLQPAGRFHPMILHFPITLVVLLLLIIIFKKSFGAIDALLEFLLYLTAFFASLSALLGLLLSREEGYDETLLGRHMWSGVAISFLSYVLLLVYRNPPKSRWLFNTILGANLLFLVLGSHFGASLTHGEDYLFQPLQEEVKKKNIIITDSTPVFAAVVEPVLESKCYSCHNEKKSKGELVMTSVEKLLKGGKDGPIWKAGDPLNSHIIQRLQLDVNDKKHMPPRGKPQLTPEEIKFIHAWIQQGADLNKTFKDYAETDSFRLFAGSFVQPAANKMEEMPQYNFPFADEKLISKLSNPNRSISPLSGNSPALQVSFFIQQQYQPKYLKELEPLKQQVIAINLTNMPVKDDELKTIAQFINLEKLILNGTGISGKTLGDLKTCFKLKSLSLSNTKVTAEALSALATMPSLKEVYLWNTGIMNNQLAAAEKKSPGIKWYSGYTPDPAEKLKLTPPLLKYDDRIILSANDSVVLTHPMPGVVIRYTADGTEPDSTSSPEYKMPFRLKELTTVKARSVKPGWHCSDVVSYTFFTQGKQPQQTVLFNQPDPKYQAQAQHTLTDLKKADINIQKIGWLGYREKDFAAGFLFREPAEVENVTLSLAKNIGGYIFPPQQIKIWGGDDTTRLKLIGELIPEQPKKYEDNQNLGLQVAVKKGNYRYIKIIASPVKKLPKWHSGKGKKGWIFIDEVFFQ
jgi:uncharacterized membrane protein